MATCESLEAELNRLRTEASGLKNRVAALEAAGKNNNSKPQNTKPYDDSEIRARLDKIEAYINILHSDLDSIAEVIKSINSNLEPLFKLADDFGGLLAKGVTLLVKLLFGS